MKGGKRVMIIDAESQLRASLNISFKEMGYTVVAEASNDKDVMAKYSDSKPDIVTMNLGMPGTNGLETLKGILDSDPDAKVVVISGPHQKGLLIDALDVGAKDFLIEPFDKGELAEVASRCTD